MTLRPVLSASAALALVLCSCAPAVKVDREAEALKIRALSAQWLVADSTRNDQAATEFYGEHAVEMAANTRAVQGKPAILAWYRSWLLDPNNSISFATDTVIVSAEADMALERGHYRFVTRGKDKESVDIGKYLTVWQKENGAWKVQADMANSDLPLP